MGESLTAINSLDMEEHCDRSERIYCAELGSSSMPRSEAIADRLVTCGP
jgi:hypothetical protein